MGLCLMAWCFPSCSLASTRTSYDRSNWCFNFLCVNLFVANNIIREGYGIRGDCCMNDVCLPALCTVCTVNRLAQEVRIRGPVQQKMSTGY